jgi:hypothetical protein
LYTIRATPSLSDHSSRTVGIFTTVENARRLLPDNAQSHDGDDKCTWFYTIEVSPNTNFDPKTVNPTSIPYLPYTGW